jgi:acetamidase/formamidase
MKTISLLLLLPALLAAQNKIWNFEPKEFARFYSAAIPPALTIAPGDTVRTYTIDAGGLDSKRERRSPGGNPETGPFFIEGAAPGDTLAIHLIGVKLNRDSAHIGNRLKPSNVTTAYAIAAKYDPEFNSDWTLDAAAGVARLTNPTPKLKNFTIPLLPMIGCIATAPPNGVATRAVDLGTFGGNMDYNQMGEGMTLYLPVYNPGALLFLGDGHAAMGDGELTGSALETSLNVEFKVDVIKGFASSGPRAENDRYIFSMGIAGSVQDAIQNATAQMAAWLKTSYALNDNEIAVVMGTVAKYDIAELVDSSFNVVVRLPRTALAPLR